ncbi:MAG: hypothetical protein ABIT01_18220, partial [Thermoanaerobaculia bacterium]
MDTRGPASNHHGGMAEMQHQMGNCQGKVLVGVVGGAIEREARHVAFFKLDEYLGGWCQTAWAAFRAPWGELQGGATQGASWLSLEER